MIGSRLVQDIYSSLRLFYLNWPWECWSYSNGNGNDKIVATSWICQISKTLTLIYRNILLIFTLKIWVFVYRILYFFVFSNYNMFLKRISVTLKDGTCILENECLVSLGKILLYLRYQCITSKWIIDELRACTKW